MKKIIVLLIIINSIFLIGSNCFAKSSNISVPDDIRVGLFYGNTAKSQITLSSPGGIKIGINKNGVISYKYDVEPNVMINVSKGSNIGSVKVEGYGEIGSENEYPYFESLPKNGLSIITINNITFSSKKDPEFRGNIEIRRLSGSDMTIINHLSMQEYLYGVVPREIGGTSPIEACKAQAIIARTYAAKNYNKRMGLGFNLTPNTDDQAYGGYKWENTNSNKAVDETDGIVATYAGSLINGNYFSTSGGYTENSENVWSSAVDYLKAVPDTYEPEVAGKTSWEVTLSATEIKSILDDKEIYIGDIVDLIPTKLTDVGRVLELKIVGTNGEKIISKSDVRSYFGLKSQWYSVNDEAPTVLRAQKVIEPNDIKEDEEVKDKKVEDENVDELWYLKVGDEEVVSKEIDYSENEKGYTKELEDKDYEKQNEQVKEDISKPKELKPFLSSIVNFISNGFSSESGENIEKREELKASTSKNTFTFRGRGYGHAVGMSQNGAIGMAKEGFSAEEIIKWYFTGVKVES